MGQGQLLLGSSVPQLAGGSGKGFAPRLQGLLPLLSSPLQLVWFFIPESQHSGQSQLKSRLPWGQNVACHIPHSSQKGGQGTTGESFPQCEKAALGVS